MFLYSWDFDFQSFEVSQDLHMVQLMPLPLTISCFSKSRLVLPFWYRFTWVVPDKGPLNGCCIFNNSHTSGVLRLNSIHKIHRCFTAVTSTGFCSISWRHITSCVMLATIYSTSRNSWHALVWWLGNLQRCTNINPDILYTQKNTTVLLGGLKTVISCPYFQTGIVSK